MEKTELTNLWKLDGFNGNSP